MAPLVPSSQNFADLQLQLYETEKERDDLRETVSSLTTACHELQGELRQETVSRLALRATVLTLQEALRESDALYEERAVHCEKLAFRLSSLTYVDRGPLLDVPPKKKKKKKRKGKTKETKKKSLKKGHEDKARTASKKGKVDKEEKVDREGKADKTEKESSSKRKRKKKKKASKSKDGTKQEGEAIIPPVDPTTIQDESATDGNKESPNVSLDESSTAAHNESPNDAPDESATAAQNEPSNAVQDQSSTAPHNESIAQQDEVSALLDHVEEEEQETLPLVSADEVAMPLPPSEADAMDDPAGDEEEDNSSDEEDDDYDDEGSVDFDCETDDESVATEADDDDASVGSFLEVDDDDDPATVDESAIADSIRDGPVRAAFYQLLLQRDQSQLRRLQLQGQLRKSERKVEQLSDMLNQNSTVMQVSYSATTVDEQKTQKEGFVELNAKVERTPADHGVPEGKSAAQNLGKKFNMKNPSLKWLMKGQKIPQLNVPRPPSPQHSKVASMRQKLFRPWSPTAETPLDAKRPANKGSANTDN
jgi:hypothetical protein